MESAPDIRPSHSNRYPAGPPFLTRVLSGRALWQSPIDLLTANARRYGDMVHVRTADGPVYQINHPELIAQVVVEHERHNRRVLTTQRARALLGDGLLTSEEPLHMRQRRMAAPAFHWERIASYGAGRWRLRLPAAAAVPLPTTVSVNLRPRRGMPLLLEAHA